MKIDSKIAQLSIICSLVLFLCGGCMAEQTCDKEEFHLVYLDKVRYDKLGNRGPSTAKSVNYIGKFVIENCDNFYFTKIPDAPDSAIRSVERRFHNWKTGATSLYNSNDKKYYKYGDNKFIEAVKQNLNAGSIGVIKPEIGIKYFNANMSEDIDNELINSIVTVPIIKRKI